MPRTSAITQAHVNEAAASLLKSGVTPTIGTVQSHLRTTVGSPGGTLAVTSLLNKWKSALGETLSNSRPGVPSPVSAAADALIEQALIAANATLAEQKDAIELASHAHKQHCDQLVSDVQAQLAHAQSINTELSIAKNTLATDLLRLETDLHNTLQVASDLRQQLDSVKSDLSTKTAQLAKMAEHALVTRNDHLAEMARLEKSHSDQVSALETSFSERLLSSLTTHSNEIASLTQTFQSDIQHERALREQEHKRLLLEVDSARTETVNLRKTSSQQLEKQVSKIAYLEQRLHESEKKSSFLSGSLQSAQALIEELKRQQLPPPVFTPEKPSKKQQKPNKNTKL